MVVAAAAFYLLWGRAVIPALFDSDSPAFLEGTGMPTGPGQIIDLAFLLPLTVLAGAWTWQRRAWGYLLGGAMLVMLALESISIGVDQWFGAAADPSSTVVSTALTPAFVLVGAWLLLLLGLYVRGTRPTPDWPPDAARG